MTAPRVFLGLNVLIWIPYGIYCFAAPEFLAEAAGIAASTATGTTELRAMYGGAQIAIGALCLLGLLRKGWGATALGALTCLTAGLGSTRLLGAFLDGSFTEYTIFALCFEFGLVAIAGTFLATGRAQEL